MAVPGVGGDFAGPAFHRGDPRKPHLPVDMLAGTAEFRLEQVAEVVAVEEAGGGREAARQVGVADDVYAVRLHGITQQVLVSLDRILTL